MPLILMKTHRFQKKTWSGIASHMQNSFMALMQLRGNPELCGNLLVWGPN